jgi:predicted RNA-binding protein YlxR (DUF448 family)
MRRKAISQHIPQRTCVACRQARPKRELIRLVRTTDSGVDVDRQGKTAGRGAYLCHRLECWEVGLKNHRLDYALRTTLSAQNREELWQQARDIMEGDTKSGQNK